MINYFNIIFLNKKNLRLIVLKSYKKMFKTLEKLANINSLGKIKNIYKKWFFSK